ncbi:MAG: 23S rRNA (pseudouridine(1915)-N(3))-methyltransferase RlmH [Elusimicrobia bacterium]|nr:23S rRNA (pseudouridine(1915)-N(3))-methyltransferase RlmH [Elusimicrobiota bacterium]
MKVVLRLAWHKPGAPWPRAFKLPGASDCLGEYAKRLARTGPFEIAGGAPEPTARLWLLDRAPGAKVLSSEEVAAALGRERDAGTGRLEVLVGGPDGFPDAERARLKPALRWSFGPLTLPHELATVTAAEQLYRAFSILAGSPYHLGH